MGNPRLALVNFLFLLASLIVPSLSINHDFKIPLIQDSSTPKTGQKNTQLFRWGAVASWTNLDDINTDAKLAGLARQGCYELSNIATEQKLSKWKKPTVMAAIRVGNKVYFSSSGKNYAFFYGSLGDDKNVVTSNACNAVALTLKRCAAVATQGTRFKPTDVKHANSAQCGEMFALQEYCILNPPDDGAEPGFPEDAKAVAVQCNYDDPDQSTIKPACTTVDGDEERVFGCKQVLDNWKLSWIGSGSFEDPVGTRPSQPGQATCVLPEKQDGDGGDGQ